jgi:2-phospho-L-lactate transferase/gluconeogenesis factor (CofD/UPF0052 family)
MTMEAVSQVPKSDGVASLSATVAEGLSFNSKPRGVVVFSGGSAANSLVDVFRGVVEDKKCQLSYIIPISDNGGSSSELIRVFGGPGIGDLRSMCSCLLFTRYQSLI